MLNRQPIFLTCFAKSGSTMLMNLLSSHPDVCVSESGEMLKVFKPRSRFDTGWNRVKKRFLLDYPVRLIARQDIFNRFLLKDRKPIPDFLKVHIDKTLYHGRFKAMVESHNLYKYEGIKYTREELAECRLLTKALDGLIFTVGMFREMYPDAHFVGLVRSGLAICDGRVRRGWPVEHFAKVFNAVGERMLILKDTLPNYHMVRYEDIIARPVESLRDLYRKVRLDPERVPKVRLETRPVLDAKGNHRRPDGADDNEFVWYTWSDMHRHIRPDINTNQIRHLSEKDRSMFLKLAGKTMERLGYDDTH